jgi:hypothetical protein
VCLLQLKRILYSLLQKKSHITLITNSKSQIKSDEPCKCCKSTVSICHPFEVFHWTICIGVEPVLLLKPPLYNPTFWPLFPLTLSILVALLSQHDWHLPKLFSCQIYAIVRIITPDSSAFNGVILLASSLATFERAPNQSGNHWQPRVLWSWSWIAGYQSIESHPCSAVFWKNIPMMVNLHHCRFQLKSHEPDIAKFYQSRHGQPHL